MSKHLEEPILDRGITNTNFFNGRVLTADDLKNDQKAQREQRRLLGEAIGEGIVNGLEVRIVSAGGVGSVPVVSIGKGHAVNRSGQTLSLPIDERVSLVRRLEIPPPEAGLFTDCGAATESFTGLAAGPYLLVVGPASGYRESVPMRGLNGDGTATMCGSRYAVEGVQFRLAKIDINAMSGIGATTRAALNALMLQTDPAGLSKLRNMLAHLFFGTGEMSDFTADPFRQANNKSVFATYGALDFMRARGDITNCEVPLAIVYWRGATIRFLDMWSVRRRAAPHSIAEQWPATLNARRASEGEAMFLQFQEHLESLRTPDTNTESLSAKNYFRYLPPVGMLSAARGSRKGFQPDAFFAGIVRRSPHFMEGARLQTLLQQSVGYAPIDLTSGEMVWLYHVRQSAQSIESTAGRPYVVFTSGHVPYQATARFDVSRWDYSNYAGCECCASSGAES